MKRFFICCLVLTFLISLNSFGQGCSDAGFCTMGAMQPAQIYTKKLNFKLKSIEFGQNYSKTTTSPDIFITFVDFNFGVTEKASFQVKVPFQFATGNLGSVAGMGDISLSFTQNIKSTETYHINGTVGFKIPVGNGDEQDSDPDITGGRSVDMPMYYQPSLGTFDFVAGASFLTQKWLFAAGIQIPLIQNNENDWRQSDFLPPLGNYPSPRYLDNYDPANDLERGIDIMVRAQRSWNFSRWDLYVGLLPIIRVTKDEITDIETGERVKLDGTTGMALTGLASTAYNFNTTSALKFLAGIKITERDVNPDGLTRNSVVTISYIKRF